jgi:class 3 adenylate cyclase
MAEPVAEHGGEVLKFLGDGLLAVFPITERNVSTILRQSCLVFRLEWLAGGSVD